MTLTTFTTFTTFRSVRAGFVGIGLSATAAAALFTVGVPAPATAQVAKPSELKYPRLPDFTVPKPTRFVLDNGMVVLVMEDHELPLVNVVARIRTGTLLDPADKAGLGSIAGDMIRDGGSATMTPDELDEFLEGRAASIGTSTGGDSGSASMSALKADVPAVMQAFADVLRKPRFDADRLSVAMTGAQAGIARQNDDPQGIRSREFQQVIYGENSPFARDMTYASLANITREDLVAWHGKYLHPNRIILGIVGDITVTEARALVTKAFGDWKKGPAATEKFPEPRTEPSPGVFEVVKDDSTQAFIAAGHQGSLLRTNPDFYAVEVLNEVLSGGFTSRLFSNVRTAKGLAYNVGGSIGAGWVRVAPFQMTMSTKAETTVAGVEAMVLEAKDLLGTRPPTDAEVELGKSSILNSFIFNSDSPSEVLGQQITFEYYGQPVDWLDRYRAGIDKVTTAQVAAAAKKYLHPDKLSILVVGPEKGRDKPLSALGTVKQLDITIPEPPEEKPVTGGGAAGKGGAAGAAGAGAAAAAAASPEAAAQGKKLVEKAVEGFGGGAAVDGVKVYEAIGDAAVETPQGSMQMKVGMTVALPDRMRQEMNLPIGQVVMVVGPKGAFITTPQGTQAMPDSMRKRTETDWRRSPLFMLRNRNDPSFKATAAGSGKSGDTAVELVTVESGGLTSTWGIDPATGRILTSSYRGEGPGGVPGTIEHTYSDFKPASGLTLPHKMSATFGGKPMMSSTTETITVNAPVEDAKFEATPTAKPPQP
jgi:zinc protease